jgi:hypothetical protein
MSARYKVKLFAGIYAEETERQTLVVRREDGAVSPHEYAYYWYPTSSVVALRRVDGDKVDVLFASGQMLWNAYHAYELGVVGDNEEERLVAVMATSGTIILNEKGHYLFFASGYPRIEVLYGKFLVVYSADGIIPHAKLYDLDGNLITEGVVPKVVDEARKKIGKA